MLDRWSRLAPLTGIVFAGLLIAAFAVGGREPGVHATGLNVLSYYKAHHSQRMASDSLTALGVVFLLFFAAALRTYLRRIEGARPLAALGFGGAVVLGIGFAIFSALSWALADARNTLDPSAAQALNVLSNDFFWPFAIGVTVFGIGYGLAIARSGALPRWLGWVAFLIGILGMTPISFIAFFALLAWSLIVSALMYVRGGRSHATPATAPGAVGNAGP
jgi:Domain of unknown function (DUF4386)